MKNYDAVYRNTGTTPRTMRRVEDHYALHTFKTEWEDAKQFFIGVVIVALFAMLCVAMGYGFMAWVDSAR